MLPALLVTLGGDMEATRSLPTVNVRATCTSSHWARILAAFILAGLLVLVLRTRVLSRCLVFSTVSTRSKPGARSRCVHWLREKRGNASQLQFNRKTSHISIHLPYGLISMRYMEVESREDHRS